MTQHNFAIQKVITAQSFTLNLKDKQYINGND